MTTLISSSRRLKTGTQYLPVDSIQTSWQSLSRSHCLNSRIELLNKKPLTQLPHNFADDIDNKDKPQIKDIAVESVDGQRIPINIWNIEIVGFRKE